MAHYQFESLRPYSDGNGRLGRLMVIVQLLRGRGNTRAPLGGIARFEARRDQYQDALLWLSLDGDVQSAGKRGVAERLAADLVGRPYFTQKEVSQQYKLPKQGASDAIKTLLDLGIIKQSGTRAFGKAGSMRRRR